MGLLIAIVVFFSLYIAAFALNVLLFDGIQFGAIPVMVIAWIGLWLAMRARNKYNVWRGISKLKDDSPAEH